jgi:hypothetical protein
MPLHGPPLQLLVAMLSAVDELLADVQAAVGR